MREQGVPGYRLARRFEDVQERLHALENVGKGAVQAGYLKSSPGPVVGRGLQPAGISRNAVSVWSRAELRLTRIDSGWDPQSGEATFRPAGLTDLVEGARGFRRGSRRCRSAKALRPPPARGGTRPGTRTPRPGRWYQRAGDPTGVKARKRVAHSPPRLFERSTRTAVPAPMASRAPAAFSASTMRR